VLEHVDQAPYHCLKCGHGFDRASGIGSEPAREPKPGSISLCIRCGAAAVFTDGPARLRELTADEERDIAADPEIARIRHALLESIAERPS
jgi:hypothetical protein